MERLEKMADFFAARVDNYDWHMLNEVEGCREGYEKMAEFVPDNCSRLLDLGCGTGLELEAIFRKLPGVAVTGIDLCKSMLDSLRKKYSDKDLTLICGDYFNEDFGVDFDCAVSFQTMHHFTKEKKQGLYKRIFDALKYNGVYIECDYMVKTQQEEDLWLSESKRLRAEQGIDENEFFHYDTPCTTDNQKKLLIGAGFHRVEQVMQIENTVMLIARKG